VRTPVPANAVYLGEGVGSVPAGKMQMLPNMPGHRRFRPPLFPNAGWDSPVLASGEKFYEDYVARYWCAPYLPVVPDSGYPGRHERGYVPPPPYLARVARSKASSADEALMERRLQSIAQGMLRTAAFSDMRGASIEPVLTIEGSDRPGGVVRAKIEFNLHVLQPSTGQNERKPDGTIQGLGGGPTLVVEINPASTPACQAPTARAGGEILCSRQGGGFFVLSGKEAFARSRDAEQGLDLYTLKASFYADQAPPSEIRLLRVDIVGRSNGAGELTRGRMHPQDPYGRALGARHDLDWGALAKAANALR
jgi:hypothetical protein